MKPVPVDQLEPYRYVESNADLAVVFEAGGLDPAKYANQDFISRMGEVALYEIFSDGEIMILEPEDVARGHYVSYGEKHCPEFTAGIRRVVAMAETDEQPTLTNELNATRRFFAKLMVERYAKGDIELPTGSAISFQDSADGFGVWFGDWNVTLPEPSPIIFDYGPGLTRQTAVAAIYKRLQRGRPMQYFGFSQDPFVNQFMVSMAERCLPGILSSGFFGGREDGMVRATNEVITVNQASDIVDVAIMNGINAKPEHIDYVIAALPTLVKTGGRLLIGATVNGENGSATFDQQLTWAEEAGFKLQRHSQVATGDARLGRSALSGRAVLTI